MHTTLSHCRLFLIFAAIAASSVSAMTLRELTMLHKSGKQGVNYVNYYLVGAMEGVLEGHAHGVRSGAKATICVNGRRLEPAMAKQIFDTELERNAGLYEADMTAQLVLANALATVYPC
jgi:hypothetical protein